MAARLPQPRRVLTGLDADGRSTQLDARYEPTVISETSGSVSILYNHPLDAQHVQTDHDPMSDPQPTLEAKGRAILRVRDCPPGFSAPMHQTESCVASSDFAEIHSIDYGIVTAGELTSVMEDGSECVLRPGDIIVQRGTRHSWRNASSTEWARIVFVLIGTAN